MSLLTWRNALRGGLIYALGDSTASLINGEFQWQRMFGMLVLGGSLYAVEIPAYFRWIDRHCVAPGKYMAWRRALLALAFFNPLWIARHMAIIKLLNGQWEAIHWDLLGIAAKSFTEVAPAALLVNYWIQNGVPLKWRFITSSAFSSLMAVYYAVSEVWFE